MIELLESGRCWKSLSLFSMDISVWVGVGGYKHAILIPHKATEQLIVVLSGHVIPPTSDHYRTYTLLSSH